MYPETRGYKLTFHDCGTETYPVMIPVGDNEGGDGYKGDGWLGNMLDWMVWQEICKGPSQTEKDKVYEGLILFSFINYFAEEIMKQMRKDASGFYVELMEDTHVFSVKMADVKAESEEDEEMYRLFKVAMERFKGRFVNGVDIVCV